MSTPNHDTELEEILETFKDEVMNEWGVHNAGSKDAVDSEIHAEAALHTYLYKQTLELIVDPPKSFDLVHSRTDTINHLNKLRKAAAERWGQE